MDNISPCIQSLTYKLSYYLIIRIVHKMSEKSATIMKYFLILGFLIQFTTAQDPALFCVDEATCCQGLPDVTSLGNWENCTIFYLCFSGSPTPNVCSNADRTHYNPDTKTCVEAVDGCISGTREPYQPSTSQMPPTSALPSTTTDTPPVDRNCTEDGVYFVPYPGDCGKYMICSNFVLLPQVQQCPTGTLFDPDLKECNLESLVECKPTCPSLEPISLPHDTNCSLYWLCINGIPSLRQCLPGLSFDPKLQMCNLEEQVFCPNLCPPETPVINFPHATNCSMYWLCLLGDPNLRQCPPDLLFDRDLLQCNIATEVDCDSAWTSWEESDEVDEVEEEDEDDWIEDFSDENRR